MKNKLFLLLLLSCFVLHCNAQRILLAYDTITICEEHNAADFTLFAVLPKTDIKLCLGNESEPIKVFIQVKAHLDVDSNGVLRVKQINSSDITLLAIKKTMSNEYIYKYGDIIDNDMSILTKVLEGYYKYKFLHVSYILSGQVKLNTELLYYYVDNIQ